MMSYADDLNKKRKWYISHEILCAEPDDRTTDEPLTVWENLVLIQANDPEEAYNKALQHGRDSEDEIRIDGRKGRHRFVGLKDLVLIYDDLEDGTELEWHEMQLTENEVSKLVTARDHLPAFTPTNFED
jgi:hypothetical protein